MPTCEPILRVRLDVLEENLKHVKQPSIIREAFKLELNVVFNPEFQSISIAWDSHETT